MGSGLTRRKSAPSAVAPTNAGSSGKLNSVNENPQDEAMIFKGKIGALKVIINADGSRIALMKFLKKNGLESYMDYYFEVEALKKCADSADLIQQATALLDLYNPQFVSAGNGKEALQTIWHTIEHTKLALHDQISSMPGADLLKQFKISQAAVMGHLAGHLDEFLASSYYLDWQRDQQLHERERFNADVMHTSQRDHSPRLINTTCADQYPNILVVDDSTICTKITAMSLIKSGHSVSKADNGRVALEMLSKQNYDIVLIDLHMPIMDGFDTVKLFRQYQCEMEYGNPGEEFSSIVAPSVPRLSSNRVLSMSTASAKSRSLRVRDPLIIIGMSSDCDESTTQRAFEAGVDYFMAKPFTLEKFLEIISQK